MQNFNELLLNINFPSRKEQDFFKFMEEWERKTKDEFYRRILQQREEGTSQGIVDNERYTAVNPQKREQAMQEDAPEEVSSFSNKYQFYSSFL